MWHASSQFDGKIVFLGERAYQQPRLPRTQMSCPSALPPAFDRHRWSVRAFVQLVPSHTQELTISAIVYRDTAAGKH